MTTAVVEEFKRVESVEELRILEGELVELHFPTTDVYAVGRLEKPRMLKRVVKGEEKPDISIYLKDCVIRWRRAIPMGLYEKMSEKIPSRYIPRVMERGIKYKRMLPPPDSV